jgi:hypothetical protein
LFGLISILILLGVMEGLSAIFLKFVLASSAHFLVWNPNIDAHTAWTAAGGNWDDELGWPSPRDAVAPPRDQTGAKYNPDFSPSEYPCASAYGPSFVWGDDIPLADGWVEQLSRKLGCRVANYGVSGYGTDQAYVRFLHLRQDEAPVTLFGISPENIMQNASTSIAASLATARARPGSRAASYSTVRVASNGFIGRGSMRKDSWTSCATPRTCCRMNTCCLTPLMAQ